MDNLIPMPLENGVETLPARANGLLERSRIFESLGLVSAKTEDGVLYTREPASGTMVIARLGMILEKTDATLTLTLALPGSSVSRVLAETARYTQQQRGALLGRSQPWVSRHEPTAAGEAGDNRDGGDHAI